jgi:SHS2 domain-containing protein
VLQAVDDALKSAAEAEKKTSNGADEAFKNAVKMLMEYGSDYHPVEAVAERMEKAEEEDKSSLKILNRLKEALRVRE